MFGDVAHVAREHGILDKEKACVIPAVPLPESGVPVSCGEGDGAPHPRSVATTSRVR